MLLRIKLATSGFVNSFEDETNPTWKNKPGKNDDPEHYENDEDSADYENTRGYDIDDDDLDKKWQQFSWLILQVFTKIFKNIETINSLNCFIL